jgi:hypothetical protein
MSDRCQQPPADTPGEGFSQGRLCLQRGRTTTLPSLQRYALSPSVLADSRSIHASSSFTPTNLRRPLRTHLSSGRSARRDSVNELQGELDNTRNSLTIAQAQNATLAKRLKGVEGTVAQSRKGLRPLAQQALKSVYTVETFDSGGTAWLAWKSGGQSYLVTANHVVAGPGEQVTLRQHNRTWPGTVIRTDETNDLALIRSSGKLGPALWQEPQLDVTPVAGDQLVLVGSPYGLEGTVTEGVVSRVTYDAIQTDAAANPGNSGGPAIDKDGNVVGVLLSGGGENINFAVPIQRACVELRPCKS